MLKNIYTVLVVMDVILAVLLVLSILLQTPKSTGLGGTIGGGGDSLGGGYRTRRGLEKQIYYTSWVLVAAFLIGTIAAVRISVAINGG